MYYETKVLETSNPYEALKFEQAKTNIELDFRILDFKFLCTHAKSDKSKVYERSDLDLFYSDDFFVTSYASITQKFIIEISSKNKTYNFRISLRSNANITYLKAIIKCLDNFSYYSSLKFDILQNIYKAMIKQNILIIRLDKHLLENIDKFVEEHKNNQGKTELEILISKGVDKIDHKNDQAIFHYNKNKKLDKEIQYDQGKYSRPIQKDELLFEYIYRVLGKEGRNLRGEILHLEPANFLDNPFILKDESIYVQELEDRVKYFSANYGYLSKDKTGYSVNNTLKVAQVGLKTTGSIKTDLNEELTVEIFGSDPTDDAIKSGIVKVEASDVKVEGSVGATKVNANDINIKGLTHSKSEIYAKNAFINTHKGYIEAETIYIKNLENGVVVAKNVYVQNCIGAKIQAQNIYIENLLADNKIYPSKNLIISNTLNFKNIIEVAPNSLLSNNTTEKEYENMHDLAQKINLSLNKTIEKMQNLYDYLIKNQIKIIQIQNENTPTVIQEKFLNLYNSSIEKYKNLSLLYKKLAKIKFQVDSKNKFLEEMAYETKIYIKAENIGQDNILYFYPKTDRKLELKHYINMKDCEKLFYLDVNNGRNFINSTRNYSEHDIEEIKFIFEDLRKNNP
ncbi:DUF342 domain-containing protein [Campylobacter jejuni]|nr:DUF342 domain-containing protein [Campylobacter jejuni]